MSDLSDFLLARFDDDEAAARESGADAMVGWRWKHYPPEAYEEIQSLTLAHSARVLAECDAKRRIVEGIRDATSGGVTEYYIGPMMTTDDVLELLTLPYVNHPEFRAEWKP